MKLKLTNTDAVALIDDDCLELIYAHSKSWSASFANGKIVSVKAMSKILHKTIGLGPAIIQPKFWMECDHINKDPLDNRRCNLREVSVGENKRNRTMKKWGEISSRFKRVSWNKRDSKWRVGFTKNRRYHHGGQFQDEIEAAIAADELVFEHLNSFVDLNFPLTIY